MNRRHPGPRPSPSGRALLTAGLTYRQVDYWCRKGYLRPECYPTPGTGQRRTFTPGEIAVATRIARLVAAGLAVKTAARVARAEWWPVEIGPGITVELADTPWSVAP